MCAKLFVRMGVWVAQTLTAAPATPATTTTPEVLQARTSLPGEDRRIVRSKRALRHALVRLMEEQSFDAISVNDLCECADLNRGTFYNHYKDKESLLLAWEDEIIADLECLRLDLERISILELMTALAEKQPLPQLVALFAYLKTQGAFLHAVLGEHGDGRFSARLRDCICVDFVWSVLHEKYRQDRSPLVEYYVSFYANAYLGIIEHWIAGEMKESPDEMALIALRLFFIKPGESIVL